MNHGANTYFYQISFVKNTIVNDRSLDIPNINESNELDKFSHTNYVSLKALISYYVTTSDKMG